ncbi:hypothetical protein ACIOD1_11665 [Streptomyces sp. NPDC088097]|uniref:hypothetical protein n=1 Tax=Streptomyces sp. NPDC088097 TaxID=3365823 RepID=UPI00382D5459
MGALREIGSADTDDGPSPCLDAVQRRPTRHVSERAASLPADEDGVVRWYALYALFHGTVAVTDERKGVWAGALRERGDTERRAQLRRLGASLDDGSPPALRRTLHRPPLR